MPDLIIKSKNAKPFEIRSKSATKAEIVLYGTIGGGGWFEDGITAKSFSDELKNLDPAVNSLDVRINSGGGDVFDGITIYNRLKQHKAKKTVYIDGLAASIASIIALAGDEIIMGEGALYMIHLPWTWGMGNRKDFESLSDRLSDVEEQMLGIYAKRSNLDRTEIKTKLEAETWMDADETIEFGFADSKSEEEVAIAASAMAAPWMNKAPRNFRSVASVNQEKLNEFRKKVEEMKARI